MYQSWASTTGRPPQPLDRPVWVDLSAFYGPTDGSVAGVEDPPPGGWLVATGRVPGLLKWWVRAVDGRWFGKVNFTVCDSYGAVVAEHLAALVPASALTPRDADQHR